MSLECWTRYNNKGTPYTTCEEDGKQLRKKSNINYMNRNKYYTDRKKPPVPRQKKKKAPIIQDAIDSYKHDIIPMNTIQQSLRRPIIQDAIDSYKHDIIPMDISRGSTQRRVEIEDRRTSFLQRDRRNRYLDMTNTNERDNRRQAFSRTLSNPQEFMGKTFKAPQIPVNPRYLKRMAKTTKQIEEGNYKSKQAEYRAKRQYKYLKEYLDYDAQSKKAKTQDEYDELRRKMDIGEFMKWERYGKMKQEKYKKKKSLLEV
jgi:hypothetical protein